MHDILYRREWKTVIAQAQPMRAIVAKALARSTPKELAEEKEQGQESSFFPLCAGTVFTMVTMKRNRKTRDERQSGQKGATNAVEDQPMASAAGQPQRCAGQLAIGLASQTWPAPMSVRGQPTMLALTAPLVGSLVGSLAAQHSQNVLTSVCSDS